MRFTDKKCKLFHNMYKMKTYLSKTLLNMTTSVTIRKKILLYSDYFIYPN